MNSLAPHYPGSLVVTEVNFIQIMKIALYQLGCHV